MLCYDSHMPKELIPYSNYRTQILPARMTPGNPAYIFWQEIRSKLVKRSGGTCELCLEIRGSEAHHKAYKGVLFWEDKNLDKLLWVCKNCHYIADLYRSVFGDEIVPFEVAWPLLLKEHKNSRFLE